MSRTSEEWDFILNCVGQNRESGYYPKFCRQDGCGGGNTGTECWLCGHPFDKPAFSAIPFTD